MKNKNSLICLVIFFIFIFVITYFIPYVNDDFFWASDNGIKQLSSFFKDYNGRYLGNLLVIILVRFKLFKSFFVAFCLTTIIILIDKIFNFKKDFFYIVLSILFIVGMNNFMFMDTVIWTSGFTNYVVPMLLVLICIYFNNKIMNEKKDICSLREMIISFVLGISTTLFMENITLYCFSISVIMLIYYKIKYKKISRMHLCFFIGTLIGTFIMFSNGAYLSILSGTNKYGNRSFETSDFLSSIITKYAIHFNNDLIFSNILFITFTSFAFFNLIKASDKKKKSVRFSLCYLVFYIISSLVFKIIDHRVHLAFLFFISSFFSIFYFIVFIYLLEKSNISIKAKKNIFFYILSIIILVVPLIMVNPINSRCFLPTYIFEILICYELISKTNIHKINNTIIIKVMMAIVLIISSYCIYNTCLIYKINRDMINYLDEKKNTKEDIIYIPIFPKNYIKTHLEGEVTNDNLKKYYNIPLNIKVYAINYIEWYNYISN